jgi:hypothetical protein
MKVCIIIIMLPNQAIASTPSAPRPSGAEGRGSTAPLCLQRLRTSQACTRYSAILLEITRHLPLLPQISSDTKRNNLVEASGNDNTCLVHGLLQQQRQQLPLLLLPDCDGVPTLPDTPLTRSCKNKPPKGADLPLTCIDVDIARAQ